MLHDALITRTYVVRGLVFWVLARLVTSAVIAVANYEPFAPSVRTSAIILGPPEHAAKNERFRREYLGASFALG